MPDVIGIRFKNCGKIYDFEANGADVEFRQGDLVIVESDLGLSIGSVVTERRNIQAPDRELRKVLRKATEEDLNKKQENESFEKEARDYCFERIMARGLPMKLICTEATLDKKRIIFYFTADGRIDFREIVKDLAAKFKTRIEMRQIGVRDEAKIIGGFGICGRELCCKTFLTSFEPVSIKMAKQQELVLNMSKLSGICGRLMCCLGYEVSEADDISVNKVVEETPAPQVGTTRNRDVFEAPAEQAGTTPLNKPKQSEIPIPEPQKTASISPDRPQTADNAAVENAGQPQGGHKKRKKWRWRKFHKHGKSENK